MKRIFLSLLLLGSIGVWPSASACQSAIADAATLEVPQQPQSCEYRTAPKYAAGESALLKHISSKLCYPISAIDKEIQGITLISFTVTTKGTITGVHVTKSLDKDLDEEALRVIKSIPGKWQPAVDKKGKKVAAKMTIPIRFVLSNTGKTSK